MKWTADQVLRRILPAGAEPDFRDPSGTIRVDQMPVPEAWVGQRTVALPGADRQPDRLDRPARRGHAAHPRDVIQEGDMLHLVMREENAAQAYAVIDSGPEEN